MSTRHFCGLLKSAWSPCCRSRTPTSLVANRLLSCPLLQFSLPLAEFTGLSEACGEEQQTRSWVFFLKGFDSLIPTEIDHQVWIVTVESTERERDRERERELKVFSQVWLTVCVPLWDRNRDRMCDPGLRGLCAEGSRRESKRCVQRPDRWQGAKKSTWRLTVLGSLIKPFSLSFVWQDRYSSFLPQARQDADFDAKVGWALVVLISLAVKCDFFSLWICKENWTKIAWNVAMTIVRNWLYWSIIPPPQKKKRRRKEMKERSLLVLGVYIFSTPSPCLWFPLTLLFWKALSTSNDLRMEKKDQLSWACVEWWDKFIADAHWLGVKIIHFCKVQSRLWDLLVAQSLVEKSSDQFRLNSGLTFRQLDSVGIIVAFTNLFTFLSHCHSVYILPPCVSPPRCQLYIDFEVMAASRCYVKKKKLAATKNCTEGIGIDR